MNGEQMQDIGERQVRVPLLAGETLVEKIDDWSFANRVRSRAEAIRQLVKLGLTKENGPAATGIAPDLNTTLPR